MTTPYKEAPASKPPLIYAAPDPRGIELVKLSCSRSLRRAIVAGTTTVTATLDKDKLGYATAALSLNGYQVGSKKPIPYGKVTAGYYVGEMVGEKRIAKVTFERLTDKQGELGKSGVVFAFLYVFEGLADIAHELTSRSI